ncbi:hypothetical protein MMC25_006399 [Agyrium rufum]|nr:hypothetical protein [Agyrium rufum]
MNNEAKPRRSTKSDVLGTAKVMSYKDLERAKAERAKVLREASNAEKEAKKAADEAEEVTTGKRCGRELKPAAAVDALEPKAKVQQMSKVSELMDLQIG